MVEVLGARRISSLRFCSLSSSSTFASLLLSRGENPSKGGGIYRFSTAATLKEPITPPVQISYTQLLINGKFVDATSGKTFSAHDPRTGEVLAHVAEGDVEDVNRAVVAALKHLMRDCGKK